ncbi:MAG: hypothetical protein AAF191_14880 [Verrucomicrobiota bacterium]
MRTSPSPVFIAVITQISLIATQMTWAIGMRHDVPEERYFDFANNRITFASPSRAPRFSSVAAIGVSHGDRFEVLGSGVLISPSCVLTAAHVIMSPLENGEDFIPGLSVRFGESALVPIHQSRVAEIAPRLPLEQLHPLLLSAATVSREAMAWAELHDLAVLALETPAEGIEPALLEHRPHQLLGRTLAFAGFGEGAVGTGTKRRHQRVSHRKRAAENVVDRVIPFRKAGAALPFSGFALFDFDNGQERRNSLNHRSRAWADLIGPGISSPRPLPMEGAAYPGDSGGPAFLLTELGWRVVGISAYGTGFPQDRGNPVAQYGDILVYTLLEAHSGWLQAFLPHNPPVASVEPVTPPASKVEPPAELLRPIAP